MVIAANLGFPRLGAQRELKLAHRRYFNGNIDANNLREVAADIRLEHWMLQHRQGIHHIPSNDFSLCDHVLDMACVTGAIPERFGDFREKEIDLKSYFAMAYGTDELEPMQSADWFDTGYTYIVPEFSLATEFHYLSRKVVNEFLEAKAQGVHTRPVVLGPLSFLLLGSMEGQANALALWPKLAPIYEELLQDLADAGANWIQMDEPYLAMDLPNGALEIYKQIYDKLAMVSGRLHLMVTTYFGDVSTRLETILSPNIGGLHIDMVSAPQQLEPILEQWSGKKALSIGIVDGRSIWRGDLTKMVKIVEKAADAIGAQWVHVAPSCTLLHLPIDLDVETELDTQLRGWLSFAKQKLAEVSTAATGVSKGRSVIRSEMEANHLLLQQRAALQGEAEDEVTHFLQPDRLYV